MPLVYLDTCALQRPLDARGQDRVRTEADAVTAVLAEIVAGTVTLVTSAALRMEAARGPDVNRRLFAHRVLELATTNVTGSDALGEATRRFVALGMTPLDALHLASAIAAGAEFICTTDDRFFRKARAANTGATRVVTPLELATALNL